MALLFLDSCRLCLDDLLHLLGHFSDQQSGLANVGIAVVSFSKRLRAMIQWSRSLRPLNP